MALLCLTLTGCNAFTPAFIDLVDPSGTTTNTQNAPGHVVIGFVNNAEVDDRLIQYLESPDGGNLVLSPAEKSALRPRIRMRVQVTFTNGATQTVEFIDGSGELIEQNSDAQAFPDLMQNDLDNTVVICDVARVEVVPGSQIEVFVPASIVEYEQRQVQTAGGETGETQDIVRQTISPRFWPLQVDDIDEDNNVLLQRNIDIRDAPVPVANPVCGTVVAINMTGVLAVPFYKNFNFPSYDIGDDATVALIGGRFEFRVLSIE